MGEKPKHWINRWHKSLFQVRCLWEDTKIQNHCKPVPLDSVFFHSRALPNGIFCFIEGTNFDITGKNCTCLEGYNGPDCGIPDSVWYGHYKTRPKEMQKLTHRLIPRRIIHAVPVNHEFDFFETRVKTLDDVVDAFIIQVIKILWYFSEKVLLFVSKILQGTHFAQQRRISQLVKHN